MNKENFDLQKNLDLALKNIQKRNFTEATKIYENILKIHPSNFDANMNLGTIYAENNNLKRASELWTKAIKINPNMPAAHNNLASVYMRSGDNTKAREHIDYALKINPNFSLAYNNLGMLNNIEKKVEDAKKNFLKAIELDPKNIMSHYNVANVYQRLNDIKNSEKYYLKTIEINPKFFNPYNNLMHLYERIGQDIKLQNIIDRAEKNFIENQSIKLFKAQLLFKRKQYKETINNLETIDFNSTDKIKETSRCTILAKSLDQLSNFSKAYEYFEKANQVSFELNKNKIDKNKIISIIKNRISFFDNPKIREWPIINSSKDKNKPIFLVGFPRSGTTLLDTILRSHPSLDVIEEKPIVNDFIEALNKKTSSNLENLKFLDENSLNEMRNVYLKSKNKYVKLDSKKNYIDKMPLNMIYAGEIVRVFPEAKFIFAIRHPCDCVLSSFMQSFVLNDSMANFLNLNDSANFYSYAMTLWEKYLNVFEINYHQIKYEDVVTNFDISIKKLLKFLDLEWSDNVSEFYKSAESRGIISTPSYDQVNKPIYYKSMDRWKNYEKQISKILPILNPWIKKFDY